MKLILSSILWLCCTVEMILTVPTEQGDAKAPVQPLAQPVAPPVGPPIVQTLLEPAASQTLLPFPAQSPILTYQQPIALSAFPNFLRYPDQTVFQTTLQLGDQSDFEIFAQSPGQSSIEPEDESDFEIFVQSPDQTSFQSIDQSDIQTFLQSTDQTSTFIQAVRQPTDQPADIQTLPQPAVQPQKDLDFVVWSG